MSAPLNHDKLGKLLALASSDNDNEALAAMRMAKKLLDGAGMDFKDVAERMSKAKASTSDFDTLQADVDNFMLRRRVADLERQLAAGPDEARLLDERIKGYQGGFKDGRAAIEREVRIEANRRVREVEAELEAYRPQLDWMVLAEHFAHKNQRGPQAPFAKGILLRARTNKLTPVDTAALRKFAEPKHDGRKAAKKPSAQRGGATH